MPKAGDPNVTIEPQQIEHLTKLAMEVRQKANDNRHDLNRTVERLFGAAPSDEDKAEAPPRFPEGSIAGEIEGVLRLTECHLDQMAADIKRF